MKPFMPELPQDQRERLLKDNADHCEEMTYYKPLTQEELDIKREKLSENLIQLSQLEDELSIVKADHKFKADPLKAENKSMLTEIKTRQERITGMLYYMADQENGVMNTYDHNGEFVSSRRLRPEEKQAKLFPLPNAVNQ